MHLLDERRPRLVRVPRLEAEVLPEASLVVLGVTEGCGSITGPRERSNQTERDPAAVSIVARDPPPPFDGTGGVARGLGTDGELLERLTVQRGESVALTMQPVLELRGRADVESVEQRTPI